MFADVVSCEVMRAGTDGTNAIYVISSCPPNYSANSDIKQACEMDVFEGVIHQLPVSGVQSSVIYRNIYCAACHDEPQPQFWLVAMRHCAGESSDGQCQLAFRPNSYIPARTCLRAVSSCADDWPDATLAALCRQSGASFVTHGDRVFRNSHCAQCNHVDDAAELHCVPLPASLHVVTEVNNSSFDVVYDLNVHLQPLAATSARPPPPAAAAPQCQGSAGVYDPLLSRCVALPYCAPSWTHCTSQTSLRAARDTARALDCATRPLAINSSDHVRYDNGSVFVFSLQTLFDTDSCRYDNDSIYVCLSHQSMIFNLTLFNLGDVQRLVSVVATVVGLVALVALLSSYCLLIGCGQDNSRKMVVCFVTSVLLYHVIYVVVLAGSRLQFVPAAHLQLASLLVCVGLQYFAMAAFFWLDVLSIETYRAVRQCYKTNTQRQPVVTSCTALLVYSLYAWCVPALILAWSAAMPLVHQAGSSQQLQSSCCVLGFHQMLLFVVPTAVSVVVNVVLYALTSLMLCRRHTAADYEADTLLPDRHSPKVDTRSWSAERLCADRRHADAVSRRWNDIYVTCIQSSVLLATTWTLALLPVTGWTHWPAALWYVYIGLDLVLMMSVCLSWCSVERVWHVLATRKRSRCQHDDNARRVDSAAAASAVAGRGGRVAGGGHGSTAATGRRTAPAFTDAASLRLLMRETSI